MKALLNGLLLPGFTRFGRKITLTLENRGHIGFCWGAAEITVLNSRQTKAYTVHYSKSRAWVETRRMVRNLWRLYRDYPKLIRSYRETYGEMTSETFWRSKLGLSNNPKTLHHDRAA